MDGKEDTYKKVRGVDKYTNVLETIKRAREMGVDVTLTLTITKWTKYEDIFHVIELAKEFECNLITNIYEDAKIFNTEFQGYPAIDDETLKKIFKKLGKDMNCYYLWFYKYCKNGLKIPCLSIRFYNIIMPNGDVVLCHTKPLVLGNVINENVEAIWRNKRTRKILVDNTSCNLCYGYCHRTLDLGILLRLSKFPTIHKILKVDFSRKKFRELLRGFKEIQKELH